MSRSTVTRREFTLALAGGAALAAEQSATLGQDVAPQKAASASPPNEKSADDARQEKKQPAAPVEPREPPPEAAYLLGLIMRRYLELSATFTAIWRGHDCSAASRSTIPTSRDAPSEPGEPTDTLNN
jgi:hypothetical protein